METHGKIFQTMSMIEILTLNFTKYNSLYQLDLIPIILWYLLL